MLISHEKSSDECDQSFERHHCMAKIISELVISYNKYGLREDQNIVFEFFVLNIAFAVY